MDVPIQSGVEPWLRLTWMAKEFRANSRGEEYVPNNGIEAQPRMAAGEVKAQSQVEHQLPHRSGAVFLEVLGR